MQIYYLQRFWFGDIYNDSDTVQTNKFTMTFGPNVNIKGQIFLSVFSPGLDINAGVVGLAAACVKEYVYLDSSGHGQVVDFTGQAPVGGITVTNVVSVTWELLVQKAWAGAIGMVYYWQ
jgi:hypothetical protein